MLAASLLLTLMSVGSLRAEDRLPTPRTICYAPIDGADRNLTSLDVHVPQTGDAPEDGRPILVMIHGGGWRGGDKNNAGMVRQKVPFFTGAGFVYVTINYRLSPAVTHPVHVEDCAAAIAWVHAHAKEFGGDPDQIYVMGHSAGAHLAALIAADPARLGKHGLPLTTIKGAVLLDGAAYDVERQIESVGANRSGLYRAAFGDDPAGWPDASPTLHAREGRAIAPMLIFHTGHRADAAAQAKELARRLTAIGTPARTVHAADRDHAGMNTCIGVIGDPYTAQVLAFLKAPREAEASDKAGSAATEAALRERAGRVAALAPVASQCWLAHPAPARPVATFVLMGAMDPLVPVNGGESRTPWGMRTVPPVRDSFSTWARAIGCSPSPDIADTAGPIAIERYAGAPGGADLVCWYIRDHGHRWPGGTGRPFAEDILGPSASGLDATAEILRFFARHGLPLRERERLVPGAAAAPEPLRHRLRASGGLQGRVRRSAEGAAASAGVWQRRSAFVESDSQRRAKP